MKQHKLDVTFREYLFSPLVYIFVVPAIMFHIALELYHRSVFWGYKIPYVSSKDFFIFDRHNVQQLNFIEKLNCLYCSYVNGLMGYAKEIAGRSERYWCPFKHKKDPAQPHSHYMKFIEFDDSLNTKDKRINLREF